MTTPVAVSVIVPAYRSAETLPELVRRIIETLEPQGELEIIIVDDDSGDETWPTIVELARHDARVRGVQLARNAGQHSATLAGARLARLPISVTLDDDLQNPPEEIGRLVGALDDGLDVVYGWARHVEHELWRRVASRVIRAVLRRSLGAARSVQMSSFRAYRTSLREAFTGNVGPAVTFDALLAWGTKRFGSVEVEHHPRAHGRSNYSLARLIRFGLDSVTGYSTAPLQLATTIGLLMALVGVVLLAWVLATVVFVGDSVSGFPFLASALCLFSGTQLFALGVIGEYLARMHRRVMSEPTYVVRDDTVTTRVPFNRVAFLGNELAHAEAALANGHVSGNGPFTQRAEALLEARLPGARVLLTTSCTHTLEMAALLLDLTPGDEVIVPSFTFVSTASAFALHGGRPVFVDVDPHTLNIDPAAVEAAVTSRTRAICAVHYGGVPASPHRLRAIADANGAVLIEDAAHAFPSEVTPALGTYGALGTLSFHETKNATCGEGGALVINDPALVERAEILREKGTDRSKFQRGQVDKYTWVDVGSSYVLSDLNAAILVGQLERLDTIQLARRRRYDRYVDELSAWAASHAVLLPPATADAPNSAHVFHLRLPGEAARDALIAHLSAAGIVAVFHYQPLDTSLVGRRFAGGRAPLPVSADMSRRIVRLPLFETLAEHDQGRVIDAVLSFTP